MRGGWIVLMGLVACGPSRVPGPPASTAFLPDRGRVGQAEISAAVQMPLLYDGLREGVEHAPGGMGGLEFRVADGLGLVLRSELRGHPSFAPPSVQSALGLRARPRRMVVGGSVGFAGFLAEFGPQMGWVLADAEVGGVLPVGPAYVGPHLQVAGSIPVAPDFFKCNAWVYARPGAWITVPGPAADGGTVASTVQIAGDLGFGVPDPEATTPSSLRGDDDDAADDWAPPTVAEGAWSAGGRVAIGFVWRPAPPKARRGADGDEVW